MSNVRKQRPLFGFGIDSTEHFGLIVDTAEDAWRMLDCAGTVFVIDFSDDRLLEVSSMDIFCDKAENEQTFKQWNYTVFGFEMPKMAFLMIVIALYPTVDRLITENVMNTYEWVTYVCICLLLQII